MRFNDDPYDDIFLKDSVETNEFAANLWKIPEDADPAKYKCEFVSRAIELADYMPPIG